MAIGASTCCCGEGHHAGVPAVLRDQSAIAQQIGVAELLLPESSHVVTHLGAEPIIADILDGASVRAAIERTRPDSVINQVPATNQI